MAKLKGLNKTPSTKTDIIGKPTTTFLKLFEKVGYSTSYQYMILQLITQLEPEVLEFAEEKRLPMRTKTLLTHLQLQKELDKATTIPEQKIAFKKSLVRDLVGKKESEAKNIVHQAISDVREGICDLKTKIYTPEMRKEELDYNLSKVAEGPEGASYAFYEGAEAMLKVIKVLTASRIHEEKGEIGLSDIPDERIGSCQLVVR